MTEESKELAYRLKGTLQYLKAFREMLTKEEKEGLESDITLLSTQIGEVVKQ